MARPPIVEYLHAAARWTAARLRSRRLWRTFLAAAVLSLLALCTEAAFRAHLRPPGARVPAALYTRARAWSDGRRVEPVSIGGLQRGPAESRVPVQLEQLPDRLIQAVLAVEDQRFFDHHGLDFRRIAGAAVANLKSGGIRQGGSTITQQLAKNLFLSARRTPLRKLREATMALALEDRYDKQAILEAYLNEIYLGQDGPDAIRGVGAAARYYFGKEPDDLSLGESAMLAGMIRAPNFYTPERHRAEARTRRDLVLGLMVEQGRISAQAATRARRERISSRVHPRVALEAPYFRDFVMAERRPKVAERGVALITTLDADLQAAANRAVRQGLDRIDRPGAQAALVALDPGTGEVLAMVGGRDYRASQFNRAVSARRQPGSAFKPIVALAALGRNGNEAPRFTLASTLEDRPLRVSTAGGNWVPANYDGEFHGTVTFREALEQSLNVPFARIGLAIGPERIVDVARRLGVTSPLHPVPSLALGSSEVTLLELTRAYGVLAAAGFRSDLRVLTRTERAADVLGSGAGSGFEDADPVPPRGEQVADPAEVYLVTSALEGVVTRGTGRGLGELGGWGGLAGKSGTSNDWRDAWFVAYTPSLVVGVWVGYDDNRSLGLTGARAALPIVSRFLRAALADRGFEDFPVPDGIEPGWAESGSEAWWGGDCGGQREVFLEGTAPVSRCRVFEWGDRRSAELDWRAEALAELLQEHGDDLAELLQAQGGEWARRLVERLRELGQRAR